MPSRQLAQRQRSELHGALGALSWLGVSPAKTAEALSAACGRRVSRATVVLWYLGAKPVPNEFHVALWNLARGAVARDADLAVRAVLLRPDLHRDATFQSHFRCVRRATELAFGPGHFAEGDLPGLLASAEDQTSERVA